MRRLSEHATIKRIRALGLDRDDDASFAFKDDQHQLAYAFHAHRRHQLLVPLSGSVRLDTQQASYVLPPQRAAFVPAGLRHATSVGQVRVCSVFLDASLLRDPPRDVTVILTTPLLREMVSYAARWSPGQSRTSEAARVFFRCFGLLCEEWLHNPVPARMPRGRSREVRRAIDCLREDLQDASLASAARKAGTSSRTLRRRIADELGTSFRELTTHARLMRAMELLSDPAQRVTDVAFEVGYSSLSAFTQSFSRYAGETPSRYRARLRAL